MTSDKLPKLLAMLERQPRDTFLLYGVALEHKKAGDHAKALEYLAKAIEVDPNYSYAYYQQGQVHERAGDTAAAQLAYRAGIDASVRAGDEHARSELQAALEMIQS